MRRICYPIFVRIFNCVPRLAIANPIQFCGSYATHLCTRQFSLGSSFASYLIFSYLKVGQINTSSVPRGIAMVCHAPLLLTWSNRHWFVQAKMNVSQYG